MQRIRQHSFAALIGVLAFAAAASAQSPEAYPSARPAKSYRMAFPGETVARGAAPEEASTTLRVSAAIPVEAAPVPTAPTAGCATCGAATGCTSGTCSKSGGSSASQTLANLKARLFNAEYGCVNPVTCGNWRTERTFIFGSCCQFFNPGRDCGTCGQGCGGGGYWSKCPGMIYGSGVGTGMNPCVYDSYLNH